MRILLLSRGPHLYSTQALVRAADRLGHDVAVVDYEALNVVLGPEGESYSLHGESLALPDAVIGRVSPTYTPVGSAVLNLFALGGAYVCPDADALLLARNKWRAHAALARASVPTPRSAMVNDLAELPGVVEALGGYPVILKLLESTHGAGVVLARDPHGARSMLDAFASLRRGVLVQEYVAEARGADVRVVVCGGAVAAAMRRQSGPHDFRSNLHRGGTAEAVTLGAEESAVAVAAAAAVGLDIAGVDLLRSRRGPLVLEVNASPGLEGIEAATGIDVAAAMLATVADGVAALTPPSHLTA